MRRAASAASYGALRRGLAYRHSSLCESFSTTTVKSAGTGGIGLHNVQDRMCTVPMVVITCWLCLRSSYINFSFLAPTAAEIISTVQETCERYQHTVEPKTCNIIGAPMTYGQPYVGTDHGPSLLRQRGLLQHLTALGWRVEDLPDLDFEALQVAEGNDEIFVGLAKNHQQVGAGAKLLAEEVEKTLHEGRFPLILGGDHSIGIGSLAGILRHRPNTGVLWIDAHADLNVPAISGSGNMHGMPVGLMMQGAQREGDALPRSLDWLSEYPKLRPDQIVYVGLRDVDLEERKLIQKLGISAYTMTEIDRYGIGQVMDKALYDLTKHQPTRPLHISFDIDAVDPVLAPATGTAVRGGLSFREAHYVCEAVAATGHLASAEIVELNPTLSDAQGADDTVELGLQILTSLLGKSII